MADEQLQPVEVKLEPDQPELALDQPKQPEPPKPAPPKPEGVEVLKAQLAELEKRAELERKAREETERVARQREQELHQYRQQVEQAQTEVTDSRYQMIVNSIDAFRRDAELAKRDYAVALAAGNFEAVAEAQAKNARAEAQIVQLENGKAALEDQARQAKAMQEQQALQQTQQRQQTPSERFDAYIAQFSPRAQQYLRQHPEYATDERLNRRLLRAHGEAVDEQQLVPDTDAYYRFLDDRMAPAAQRTTVPSVGGRGAPAAPVSRQPINGSSVTGTVTLSPAEREAARIAGISEVEYAKQMLAAEAMGEIVRH